MACSKKVILSKKRHIFLLLLFLLQDNSYSCLVKKFQVFKIKIALEVIKLSVIYLSIRMEEMDKARARLQQSYERSTQEWSQKQKELVR